ncbi:TIGR01777 family oxidoreductase [Azomonas macrocytogenes]|uniref:TIGR01777 family protein n=1 Tax=Azomonas macrocytogenes TaxID=69962 RepID=A0A839T1D0_AZOMA|nr:TIGR01777 family oxidoreductase [Azomonas macrocytogenes]MBB3103351.1 hypothetical protein [Azomonas macrocytogenes]
MHILLTGGTGLIGKALCRYWTTQGHQLAVLSRTPQRVKELCGPQVQGIARLEEWTGESLDAVVNLAGAPIAERPWTQKRRTLLWDSRVTLTERLVEWLASREQKPAVLISGSAIGFYGDGGERELQEDAQSGNDFGSQLCAAWEAAARHAEPLGIRVALVRTGLVLAPGGGFLQKLLPAYRLGLGGRIGSGQQWMSWVHLDDQVALIDFLLNHPAASGPYNACAPQPVRNAEFSQALGQALHRPTILAVPAPLLKLTLGELSTLLLGGQKALPAHLQEAGFTFRYPELPAALASVLGENRH